MLPNYQYTLLIRKSQPAIHGNFRKIYRREEHLYPGSSDNKKLQLAVNIYDHSRTEQNENKLWPLQQGKAGQIDFTSPFFQIHTHTSPEDTPQHNTEMKGKKEKGKKNQNKSNVDRLGRGLDRQDLD